jgi:hypothetical protein
MNLIIAAAATVLQQELEVSKTFHDPAIVNVADDGISTHWKKL